MSHFKAKMHQIQFWLGLRPRPHCGSSQRSPDSLAGFRGPTSKGMEGREGEQWGREWRKGRGGRISDPLKSTSLFYTLRCLYCIGLCVIVQVAANYVCYWNIYDEAVKVQLCSEMKCWCHDAFVCKCSEALPEDKCKNLQLIYILMATHTLKRWYYLHHIA